jgi:hypothetical protein
MNFLTERCVHLRRLPILTLPWTDRRNLNSSPHSSLTLQISYVRPYLTHQSQSTYQRAHYAQTSSSHGPNLPHLRPETRLATHSGADKTK